MKLNKERIKLKTFFDFKLLTILILMMSTSLIIIASSSPFLSESFTMKSLVLKQLMWFLVGLGVLFVFVYNGNDYVVSLFKILYTIMLVLLIFLAIDAMIFQKIWPKGLTFGRFDPIAKVNGSTGWYNIPGIGTLQPSEFMKICLVVLNADIIAKHNFNRERSAYADDLNLLFKMAKISLPPMLLIFLQPDTGLVFIIIISLFFMVCASGINKIWLITIFSLMITTIAVFFILFFFNPEFLHKFISELRLSRIYAWIYPEKYPAFSYQSVHALIAMGSAGIQGYGINSVIPAAVHISEPHTDFIFAMTGTIFGTIGLIWVVFLQFLLTSKLLTVTLKAQSLFEKYFMIGTIGIILYQQIQNMGMVLNLLPITGITLPLISYGGSSLLSYFMLFGITMNISTNSNVKSQNY